MTRCAARVAIEMVLLGVSVTACAVSVRHAPQAHMDQNADRYRYDYDDGICTYQYEYDFKTTKDQLNEKGDCRNVPIERYHPQASIVPAYPPPGAAPPMTAPTTTATQPAPSVTGGEPAPTAAPNTPAPTGDQGAPAPTGGASTPSGIDVTPVR